MNQCFKSSLKEMNLRLRYSEGEHSIRLNKNELPFDVSDELKEEVCSLLIKEEWNRYPSTTNDDIISLLASEIGVSEDSIVLSAGAASILTTILNYSALGGRNVIFPNPSFSLYEYHCKSYGIRYSLWNLNEQLDYSYDLLPDVCDNDVVFIVSPNNPTGKSIDVELLIELLCTYPTTLFVVDEVYGEFSELDFSSLVNFYENLILVRSFSKTFSAAGIRIGYALSCQENIKELKKLILPFSLNHFSRSFLKIVLSKKQYQQDKFFNLNKVIDEKNRVMNELKNMDVFTEVNVIEGESNFVLLMCKEVHFYERLKGALESLNVRVLELSQFRCLENGLRVTIGSPDENNMFLKSVKSVMS